MKGLTLLRTWWLVTVLLAALGLTMGGAHLLELPVRSQYDDLFYMQVTSTLYRLYGMVGGPLQVLAVVFAIVLAWLLRARAGFVATLAGSLCLAASLVLWVLLVQPVNTAWLEALQAGPAEGRRAYAELRGRWEAGHVAAYAAWLLGFIFLLHGVVSQAIEARSPQGSRDKATPRMYPRNG